MIGAIGYSEYLKRRAASLLRGHNSSLNEPLFVGSNYSSSTPGIITRSREEILHDPRIEIVYISSATGYHYRDTLAALANGKHVLVEKPICLRSDELSEIDRLARHQNLVVAECLSYHFHPRWNLAMEMLHNQNPKEEFSIRASFRIPHRSKSDFRYRFEHGGIVGDLGTYVIDALLRAGTPASSLKLPASSSRTSLFSYQVCNASSPQSQADWAIGDSYKNEFVVTGETFRIALQRTFSPPVNEPTFLSITNWLESTKPKNYMVPPSNATHLCICNALQTIKDHFSGVIDIDHIRERISILESISRGGKTAT